MGGFLDDLTGGIGALFGSSGGGGGMGGIINSLAPTVISGFTQNYLNNKNEDTLSQLQQLAQDREQQNYEQQMAAYEANQEASAAAAAAKRAAMRKAMALQQEYYKRAMQYYKPFIKAGKEVLPVHTATYKGGMSALSEALSQAMGGLGKMGTGPGPGTFNF